MGYGTGALWDLLIWSIVIHFKISIFVYSPVGLPAQQVCNSPHLKKMEGNQQLTTKIEILRFSTDITNRVKRETKRKFYFKIFILMIKLFLSCYWYLCIATLLRYCVSHHSISRAARLLFDLSSLVTSTDYSHTMAKHITFPREVSKNYRIRNKYIYKN